MLFSEPKIPQINVNNAARLRIERFQCSSASRKFLKSPAGQLRLMSYRVSVLFSEPKIPQTLMFAQFWTKLFVSVLFSEPKIPQKPASSPRVGARARVSVLFSEPKIPQTCSARGRGRSCTRFQCSSASRKFLKQMPHAPGRRQKAFQCSSASRKFLKSAPPGRAQHSRRFQCSSASRKFLKVQPG